MSFFKHILLTTAAAALSAASLAQQPVVRAELDSVTILVGGQVGLNVSVQVPRSLDCHVLALPDTLTSSVEVVSVVSSDTLSQGDLVEYTTRYLVTSFDTGLQYVPPIPVVVMPDSTTASTPEFALSVVNPFQKIEVDEQSGVAKIFDINSAIDAPFQWRELLYYWPWVVIAAAIVGLFFLIRWLRRKYCHPRDKDGMVNDVPAEPCEVTALRDLERIRDEKLWLHNQVKEFYSDLTDTLRRYVASRFGVQALESTSAQLVEALEPHLKDAPKEQARLTQILEQADFAKFAKVEPNPDDNARAVSDAMEFVNATTLAARQADGSASPVSLKPDVANGAPSSENGELTTTKEA